MPLPYEAAVEEVEEGWEEVAWLGRLRVPARNAWKL
jgi:hypothetical protein